LTFRAPNSPFCRETPQLGWFLDGSYVVIVLGNYDLPGASALYQKLMGFLAAQ
jgi:hypothetical protein